MKNFILLIIFIGLTLSSYSQVWVEKDSIPMPYDMGGGFSFSIDSKLYVGGGTNTTTFFSGFYQYDPTANTWTTMANTPEPVTSTFGFTLNGMGYVVCGYNGVNNTDSVYMYNPATNTWSRKNNFPGGVRQNNACFSANGFGYVFGGLNGGPLNDMWQYNDTTDSWQQMASCPGPGRDGPTFLVINGQIYVGMGCDPSGTPVYPDFYHFNPDSNTYTQVDSMPVPRSSASQFSIGNLGYIGLGRNVASGTIFDDLYIFDPAANTWTQTDSFGGGARAGAYSETVNGVAYVGCGMTYNTTLFHDCWSYGYPNGIHSISNNTALSCYPSPTLGAFTINMSGFSNGDKEISICNQIGQTVYQTVSSEDKIQVSYKWSPGLYIISVIQNGRQEYVHLVVE